MTNGATVWMLPTPARSRCLVFCGAALGSGDAVLRWQEEEIPVPPETAACLAARFQTVAEQQAPPGTVTERLVQEDLLGILLWIAPDRVSAAVRCALTAALELGKSCPARAWTLPAARDPSLTREAVGRCAQALFRPANLSLAVVGGGNPEELAALARLLLPERREEPALSRRRTAPRGEEALRLRLTRELAAGAVTGERLAQLRRGAYGTRAMALDRSAETAEELCRGDFLGYDYLTFGDLYPAIGAAEVSALRADRGQQQE